MCIIVLTFMLNITAAVIVAAVAVQSSECQFPDAVFD